MGRKAHLSPSQKRENVCPGVSLDLVGGNTVLEINTIDLEVPERSMTASCAFLSTYGTDFNIIFGQCVANSTKVLAAFIVHIPIEPTINVIMKSNTDFIPSLQRHFTEHNYTEVEIATTDKCQFSNDRVLLERASIANFSYSVYDAEINFYKMSAHDIAYLKKSNRKPTRLIKPVIQIDLSIPLFYSLCKKMLEYGESRGKE